jgi:maltose O-acetyltransferase
MATAKRILQAPIVFCRIGWRLFVGILMRCLELAGQVFPESLIGCRVRGALYRPFLKSCGRNFQVGLQAKLEHLIGIEVGNDVYIGHGSWISGVRGGVALHDEVMLGPYVTMASSNHSFRGGSARFAPGIPGRVEVGRGTWIGGGATLIGGVTVGASCLVAAGAVVTKDVEAAAFVGGVPAKVIGRTTGSADSAPADS